MLSTAGDDTNSTAGGGKSSMAGGGKSSTGSLYVGMFLPSDQSCRSGDFAGGRLCSMASKLSLAQAEDAEDTYNNQPSRPCALSVTRAADLD